MLKLKKLSKYYYQNGVIATGFNKVDLELHIGEFVVITGESGSGKSSLLNVLSGVDTYEEGEMYINGEETSHFTENDYLEYRRKYVTNIFQNFNLINSYTVYQNIELALLLNGYDKKRIKNKIMELLEIVNMTKFKKTLVSKLSGGQKQRVAIARALAYDTPIIVADEPTASIDSVQSKSILKLLHKISEDKLVIIVTHNKKEVEKYATRLIRMHDGKILENKVIEKINKDKNLKKKEIKDISLFSEIKLSLRNTFNIPIKFFLIYIIFFFIALFFTLEYASLQNGEYQSSISGYNEFFVNNDIKRIIFNKKISGIITDEDYKTIESIDNVAYIIKEDLINDLTVGVWNENSYYFNGTVKSLDKINSVDLGRMPLDDDEIVMSLSKNSMYFTLDEITNINYIMENANDGYKISENVKIVGIKFEDNYNYMDNFYVSNNILDKITISLNNVYSTTKINIGNSTFTSSVFDENNRIVPNPLVKENEAIISNDMNSYCTYEWCVNKNINIKVKNIYYEENINLKITNLYSKYNFKKITGFNNYNTYNGNIYINPKDYNKLYNNGNYQSSLIVKDDKKVDEVKNELENLGYETIVIKNSLFNDNSGINEIFNIFKFVITMVLLLGLFIISYFVIKIILKSRNSYFATIRTLGAKKSVCRTLLLFELYINSTLAYLSFLLFVNLINNNILEFDMLQKLLSFVTINNYIVIYFLIIFMASLITLRYSRKIFKDSIIKIYREVF